VYCVYFLEFLLVWVQGYIFGVFDLLLTLRFEFRTKFTANDINEPKGFLINHVMAILMPFLSGDVSGNIKFSYPPLLTPCHSHTISPPYSLSSCLLFSRYSYPLHPPSIFSYLPKVLTPQSPALAFSIARG
jgi:hypothetical protein